MERKGGGVTDEEAVGERDCLHDHEVRPRWGANNSEQNVTI